MRPTVEYVERKFDEFNALIFGMIKYFREKNEDGTWHYYGFTFYVSNKFDLPENVVDDTIIHEMIHYYIQYNQMEDKTPYY